jgi:hypothetical protein
VTGKWFSVIKTLTTQKLSSLTCGTLISQALTVGVACTSSKKKPLRVFAQNKLATGNIQIAMVPG